MLFQGHAVFSAICGDVVFVTLGALRAAGGGTGDALDAPIQYGIRLQTALLPAPPLVAGCHGSVVIKPALLTDVAGCPTDGEAVIRPLGAAAILVGRCAVAHEQGLALVVEIEVGVLFHVITPDLIHLGLMLAVIDVFNARVAGACKDTDLGSALDLRPYLKDQVGGFLDHAEIRT